MCRESRCLTKSALLSFNEGRADLVFRVYKLQAIRFLVGLLLDASRYLLYPEKD